MPQNTLQFFFPRPEAFIQQSIIQNLPDVEGKPFNEILLYLVNSSDHQIGN